MEFILRLYKTLSLGKGYKIFRYGCQTERGGIVVVRPYITNSWITYLEVEYWIIYIEEDFNPLKIINFKRIIICYKCLLYGYKWFAFVTVGMFYLWVCAINLPILINEMEHDEQAATISKLRHLLETKQNRGFNNNLEDLTVSTPLHYSTNPFRPKNVFSVSTHNFNNNSLSFTSTIPPLNGIRSYGPMHYSSIIR